MIKEAEARKLQPNSMASILYNILLRSCRLGTHRYWSRLWDTAWDKSCRLISVPVRTTIHGRRVVVNYGHTYPVTSRRYPSFNNPLIELVFQTYSMRKKPIVLVDVGANVGDTILLLQSNCPGMLGKFLCIDADPEFFAYLQSNLREFPCGTLLLALLSSTGDLERDVVRIHPGTASAQGSEKIASTTLDSLLGQSGIGQVDVLKIDVDGLDGKVLLGATQTLEKHKPSVVFEWHPGLCQATANSWSDHFDALEQCGYSKFIWFTKYGTFSHYTVSGRRRDIEMLAQVCLRNQAYSDWHYDVVALPYNSEISHLLLAETAYARARRSRH